jgi:hypothetical protein
MVNETIEQALGIQRELSGEDTCVVSHPDAGGSCGRLATVRVWNLPFCEAHGKEAELAALNELSVEFDNEIYALREAEHQRHFSSQALEHVLSLPSMKESALGGIILGRDHARSHEEALRTAYPPIEGRAHPDSFAGEDCWWPVHWLLCRFMRQAHEREVPLLVEQLEPLREQAAAQWAQAEEDLEQNRPPPRGPS